MPRYYKFMLGEKSKYAEECYEGNFIGVWYEIEEDLTQVLTGTKEVFKEIYIPKLNEKNRGETSCLQLWKFCNELKIGDIVVCPDNDPYNSFFVGEIISGYYYKMDKYKNEEIQPHRRQVKWCDKKIYKNDMSEELKTTLKCPVTIVNLTRYSKEIESLLQRNANTVSNDYQAKSHEEISPKEKYTEIIKKYPHPIIPEMLVQFLEETLPQISKDNWWDKTVKDKIKNLELSKIEREKINNNLDEISNDVLLYLVELNWKEIFPIHSFLPQDRTVVSEMINVRNRIAHLSKNGYKKLDEILHDFNTILRFLKIIDIKQENIQNIIDELEENKRNIMKDILQENEQNP